MKRANIINQVNNSSAEIYLYGIIGKYMDIDVNYLVPQLENLRKNGITDLIFYVNSDGGDVIHGQTLWAYLDRSSFNVTYIVDGIAASMMAELLTNPKHTVIANKYSKFMYHRVQGNVGGNSDDVRSYADMMDKFETDLIDMFVGRTGMDPEKAKKEFFGLQDKWLSASEALQLKLVNEVRDGRPGISEPSNMTTSYDVYQYFDNQLTNCITKVTNMKKIALLLNLSENAAEEAIETAVQNLINSTVTLKSEIATRDKEIKGLQDSIAEAQKEKVKNLIDTAIKAKKFGEDMRTVYTEMANENYTRTESVIEKMAGVGAIIDELGDDKIPDAEKAWKWDNYHKANKLENLKATNLSRFKELYKEKFGKEYAEKQ